MKKLLIIYLLILLSSCRENCTDIKLPMRVNNVTFRRSRGVYINGNKLYYCLANYSRENFNRTSIDYSQSDTSEQIYINYLINLNDIHYLNINIKCYKDYGYLNKNFKNRFHLAKCFKRDKGIEEIAFNTPDLDCFRLHDFSYYAYLLYANVAIDIIITSSKAQRHNFYDPSIPISDQVKITEDFNAQQKIYNDIINSYYPYFRQCAEQSKVTEESKEIP